MVTHSEPTTQSNFRALFDITMVGLGATIGGIIALSGLWLWLDYQADPTHSLLTAISIHLAQALPPSFRTSVAEQAQLMGLPLTGETSAYWYMARAGGFVTYLLFWLSTVWGLMMSTKIGKGLISTPLAFGLHEFLSLAALTFAALHALVLLGDSYVEFNIFQVAIPFIAPYEPLWTALGTLTFYLAAALTGSFYIRKQIGQKTWRILHYLSFLVYLMGLTHGIMAGTDRALAFTQLLYLGTGSMVLFLVYYRVFTLKA